MKNGKKLEARGDAVNAWTQEKSGTALEAELILELGLSGEAEGFKLKLKCRFKGRAIGPRKSICAMDRVLGEQLIRRRGGICPLRRLRWRC